MGNGAGRAVHTGTAVGLNAGAPLAGDEIWLGNIVDESVRTLVGIGALATMGAGDGALWPFDWGNRDGDSDGLRIEWAEG